MPEQKKLIQFKNIVKSFEDGQVVLKGVSLDIYENEFVTLLGPSGCGKTTLLRILGGFLQPTEGKVLFDGEDIVNVPPYKREINTVFQKYALFPHMNVYDNIAFGLTIKKEPKDVIAQKVMRMLRLVSLEDYADRNVTELSGGQQQRIAIARAAARRAARRARPEAAQGDATGAQVHSAGGRHHLHLRHTRPGGGADHVRQDRSHERGRDPADRYADRDLSLPRQRVRRQLHRRDEHHRRCDAGRRPRGL